MVITFSHTYDHQELLRAVCSFLSSLSNKTFNVLRQSFLNAGPGAPECFVVQKMG